MCWGRLVRNGFTLIYSTDFRCLSLISYICQYDQSLGVVFAPPPFPTGRILIPTRISLTVFWKHWRNQNSGKYSETFIYKQNFWGTSPEFWTGVDSSPDGPIDQFSNCWALLKMIKKIKITDVIIVSMPGQFAKGIPQHQKFSNGLRVLEIGWHFLALADLQTFFKLSSQFGNCRSFQIACNMPQWRQFSINV